MREHLRACASCRATLRAYRAAPGGGRGAGAGAAVSALAARPRPRRLRRPARARFRRRRRGDDSALAQVAAAGGTARRRHGGARQGAGDLRRHRRRRRRLRRDRRASRRRSTSSRERRAGRGSSAVSRRSRRRGDAADGRIRTGAGAPEPEPAPAPAARRQKPEREPDGRCPKRPKPAPSNTRRTAAPPPAARPPEAGAGAAERQRRRGVRAVRRARGVACASLGASLAAGARSAPAAAPRAPPRPDRTCSVVGGEDTWHADNDFALGWTNPPASGPPLAASTTGSATRRGRWSAQADLSRAGDGDRAPAPCRRRPAPTAPKSGSRTPAATQGPAVSAQLRFDDARPGAGRARLGPRGWIGRTALPLHVRLGHPAGAAAALRHPRLRGLDRPRPAAARPAPAADRCSAAETDLRGGVGDDALSLGDLPEGISYVHAVAVSGSGMTLGRESASAIVRVDKTDRSRSLAGAPAGWTNRTGAADARAPRDDGSG